MTPCGECRKVWEERWHYVPNCDSCDYPGLLPENLDAWEVFTAASPALFDGMGGADLTNAKLVCEGLGHEWDRAMMKRILAAVGAFLAERAEAVERS